MSKIVITGGSGNLGQGLTKHLEKLGHKVYWLSRKPSDSKRIYHWDLNQMKLDENALIGTDCIIHLAGVNILSKRWTTSFKKEIINSRTLGIQLIQKELKRLNLKIPHIISASGVGIYGMINSNTSLNEETKPSNDFLSQICVEWEDCVNNSDQFELKTILRIGVILGENYDAIKKISIPFNFGLNPIPGDGKQGLPWIAEEDVYGAFSYMLIHKVSGVFNLSAPDHINMETFTKTLAKAKGKKVLNIKTPSFMISLILGESAGVVLKGPKIDTTKIQNAGFEFQHKNLSEYLKFSSI